MQERNNHLKGWKSTVSVMAVLVIVGFGYLPLGLAEEGKNVEQLIAEAKTPADHEAIAVFYEQEAQAAREQQAKHERMKESYAKIPPLKQKTSVISHCEAIAKKYREMAQEYEALAQLHKEMAASEEGKNVEQMIAEAKAPTDHEAIAAFYEEEARAARQKQTQHEKMGNSYAKRYPTKKTSIVPHCEAIAKKYQEMAQEYEALAQLHREMAQSAQ